MDTSFATDPEGIHKLTIPTPFPVGPVNVYIVAEDDSVTLFDAGPKTEDAWDAFTQQLNRAGFSIHDIDQVILTHHHPDHCGLLDWLLEKKNLPVLAHPSAEPWVTQDADFFAWYHQYFARIFRTAGVDEESAKRAFEVFEVLRHLSCRISLNQKLREGTPIPGMQDWQVVETPGHAQSHLVFYREKDGVLLAGDHLIKEVSPNPVMEPPIRSGEERPKALIRYRESLIKCKQLKVNTAFSGHGEEITDVQALIRRRLSEQEERRQKIKTLMRDQPLTPFEISQLLFPYAQKMEISLTLSEIIGFLDWMEACGEITGEREEEKIRYRTA
ncbi:MBL fold metallo-hydrolase [Paludifilum halophilum]|uniref:MBL fold metallo-hydrolase n=1 Tax=Paludifilum halophilum TaxID=1642702 RepID=UPI001F0A7672|nr:MBL fold metallo-hydrolase [Paludifilum halophilum]